LPSCEYQIEHISETEAVTMIRECFRVLRRRGRIRIATPDLSAILKVVAEDADGLAAASAQLLLDEPLRRSLVERARRFVIAHHRAAAYARRLEREYEETIAVAEARR
jgi:predicted SAM-dependent methyltransferase